MASSSGELKIKLGIKDYLNGSKRIEILEPVLIDSWNPSIPIRLGKTTLDYDFPKRSCFWSCLLFGWFVIRIT